MSLLFENNCIKHETGEFYILPEYFYDEWNIRKRFWLKEEDENEIKMLLWEVYHISKWIHDMLKSGNLISSVILLRTLMERIVLFRILLKERDKISEKIKIYVDHGLICAYLWLKELWNISMDDKEYFEKCKKCFEENWAMYEIKKKGWDSCFNLYKGLWYTSTAISHLFNIHIKKELEKKWKKLISLYSVLSDYLEYF